MASCKCTNPPGGSGRCERGQIAFCRVINDQCTFYCKDPRSERYQIGRSLYFAVENRDVNSIIGWFMSIEDLNLDGRYFNNYSLFTQAISQSRFLTRNNQIITCKIPRSLKRRIIRVMNTSDNN